MRRVTGAKALRGLLVFAVSITAPRAVLAQVANDTLRLEQVLSIAGAMNPALQAAVLGAEASSERAAQSGALPDPMLSLGLMNWAIDGFGPSEPMSLNSVQLTQRFPWPGKLGFAADRERHLAQAQFFEADESQSRLLAQVKSAYFRLAQLDRAIQIALESRELLRNLLGVASTRYAVGTGLQQDVLQAQVAVAQMTEDVTVMQQNRLAMAARLNTLLGRAATTTVGPVEFPTAPRQLPSVDSLMALATRQRPALAAARERTLAAESATRAARRALYPDLTVTVGYGQRPDYKDLATLMVGFTIPIWAGSKQKPLRREMQALHSAAAARSADLHNETFASLAELSAAAVRAGNLAELYATSILPQARAAVESALSAYRVGDVDYTTLVTHQMTVNRYAIQRVQLIADHARAVAEIEALLGGRLGG